MASNEYVIKECEDIAAEFGLNLYLSADTSDMCDPIRVAFIREPFTAFTYVIDRERWTDESRGIVELDLEAKLNICSKYEIKRSEAEKPEEPKEQTLVDYCKEIKKLMTCYMTIVRFLLQKLLNY